jgi:hypothetical protein
VHQAARKLKARLKKLERRLRELRLDRETINRPRHFDRTREDGVERDAGEAVRRQVGIMIKRRRPSPNELGVLGRRAISRKVDEFALSVAPLIREAEGKGVKTHSGIASFLASRGVPTRLGGEEWSEPLVKSIRARLAALAGGD